MNSSQEGNFSKSKKEDPLNLPPNFDEDDPISLHHINVSQDSESDSDKEIVEKLDSQIFANENANRNDIIEDEFFREAQADFKKSQNDSGFDQRFMGSENKDQRDNQEPSTHLEKSMATSTAPLNVSK